MLMLAVLLGGISAVLLMYAFGNHMVSRRKSENVREKKLFELAAYELGHDDATFSSPEREWDARLDAGDMHTKLLLLDLRTAYVDGYCDAVEFRPSRLDGVEFVKKDRMLINEFKRQLDSFLVGPSVMLRPISRQESSQEPK